MSIEPDHPEYRVALGYASPEVRPGLALLLALDEKLAGIVARTTEPTIGLMRLVWWRDALEALVTKPPPAEPLLVAAHAMVASGVAAHDLAAMIEGWAVLLDDPDHGDETVAIHARERGGRLFALAGALLAAPEDDVARLMLAGEGWARADLARHVSDPARAVAILASARGPLEQAMISPWHRRLRPIAQLGMLAHDDVRRGAGRWQSPASRARLLRILRFQITGR